MHALAALIESVSERTEFPPGYGQRSLTTTGSCGVAAAYQDSIA